MYKPTLFSILLGLFTCMCYNIQAQTVNPNHIDGIIYLKTADTTALELSPYNNSDAALNTIISTYGVDSITKPFGGLNTTLNKTYRIYFSKISLADALIAQLELLPYVEYAEPAALYRTSYTPNDFQGAQWSLSKINAFGAWNYTKGSKNIKIAIVDNAVSTTHEDLKDNIWVNPGEVANNGLDDDLNGYTDDMNGWDAADNDNNPNPPASANSSSPFVHGTHCAGIASAKTDNSKGLASIGFNTSIMAVKCSNNNSADNGNTLPGALDGLYYAIRANADVISMSWGDSSGTFLTAQNLINMANARRIVLVAAAGNANNTTPFYPAAYNNVISVGATNQNDNKSSFSNYGSWIDVMAPGSDIYSTLSGADNAYGNRNGTSMACPLVAGLAGLILAVNPGFSPAQVESFLKSGCEKIDNLNPGYEGKLGAGRINALKSIGITTAVHKSAASTQLGVYPNPSNGKFYLMASVNNIGQVTISDLNGRQIEILKADNQRTEWWQTEAPAGLYIITATLDNGQILHQKIQIIK